MPEEDEVIEEEYPEDDSPDETPETSDGDENQDNSGRPPRKRQKPKRGKDEKGKGAEKKPPTEKPTPKPMPKPTPAAGAAGGGSAAAAGAGEAVVVAESNPIGWIVTGIVILIIILIIIIMIVIMMFVADEAEKQKQNSDPNTNEVTIKKSGPQQVPNSSNIQYTINVKYPLAAQEITITDQMVTEKGGQVSIVSGPKGHVYAFDATTKKNSITWKLSDTATKSALGVIPGPINQDFTLVIKPPLSDDRVYNFLPTGISIPAAVASGSADGYSPPNDNNCSGKYKFTSPIKNFGDPTCDFTKDKLFTILKEKDPKNANFWFNKVVPCESGYNPNAYASHASIGTPDAAGAWGLYQMGSSKPPGSEPTAKGKNGVYDRGDVPWARQTTNATTYLKNLEKNGLGIKDYWACAR